MTMVGSVLPLACRKSLPEPLKSLDCFTCVVIAAKPAGVGSSDAVKVKYSPGAIAYVELVPSLPSSTTRLPAESVMVLEPAQCDVFGDADLSAAKTLGTL